MTDFFTNTDHEAALRSIVLSALGTFRILILGNVFISYPEMMIKDVSKKIMDQIFHGDYSGFKKDLLKIFLMLLHKEAELDAKNSFKPINSSSDFEEKVDMGVLVGFSEDLGKANILSSIVQVFLQDILDSVLSPVQDIVLLASDIIEMIVSQGLVHPLAVRMADDNIQCITYIVALETHPLHAVRAKSIALHTDLAERHNSFIHSKNMECFKMIYNFQNIRQTSNAEYLKGD